MGSENATHLGEEWESLWKNNILRVIKYQTKQTNKQNVSGTNRVSKCNLGGVSGGFTVWVLHSSTLPLAFTFKHWGRQVQ